MKLFVVCLALLITNLVQAETGLIQKEELTVLLPDIEGWGGKSETDKNYHFVNYLSKGLAHYDIKIVNVPPARAIALFNRMESGCFLGGDPKMLASYVDHNLQFFKIMDTGFYAMTLKDSSLDSIEKTTSFAVMRGFDTETHLPAFKDRIIAEYNDIEQAIMMLERKRVQAFLYWDVLPQSLANRLKMIEGGPLQNDEMGLNCIDNVEGNKLIKYLAQTYHHSPQNKHRIVRLSD
jgi:hypothetical protein